MSLRARGRTLADMVVGSSAAARLGSSMISAPLRILGFHGIDDAEGFERQLGFLSARFNVVDQNHVLEWLTGDRPLPERAAWVTFDDGDPTIVTDGLVALRRHSIRATAFICPGVIGTETAFWWQTVETARRAGIEGVRSVGEYKSMPDHRRRAEVQSLCDALESTGVSPSRLQMSIDQLNRWIGEGHAVGNHTWDHPLLDRCPEAEQQEQIRSADQWIRRHVPGAAPMFAYPNGNWSEAAEHTLIELGYQAGVLFDHRLARGSAPLRLSRIRVNANGDLRRFRASASGWHPMITAVRARRPAVGD